MPFWLVPPTAEPLSLTGFPLDKVRALQHTLYRTAKADPGRRFHALWDKVLRRDVLWRAWMGTVITPGPHKPWREKPNAGGERRR